MKNKNIFGIGARIFLLLLISSLITVTIGVSVFFLNNSLNKNFTNVLSYQKQFTNAQNIKYYDEVLTQSLLAYIYSGDETWLERYLDAVDPIVAVVDSAIAGAEGNPEIMELFNKQNDANNVLIGLEDQIILEVKEGNTEKALAIMFGSEYQAQKQILFNTITDFINDSENGLTAFQTHAEENIREFSRFSVIIMVIALAVGLILLTIALLFSRNLSRNIWQMVSFAEKMSQGNLDEKVDSNSNDEIGILGETLTEMIHKLKPIISMVRETSEQVSSNSSQLNSTVQALSEGATEQAASTEEVSSSMEQMAGNIEQNSDNAYQTGILAKQVNKDAKESGSTVKQAVAAMKDIVDKISIINFPVRPICWRSMLP